MQNRMLGEKLSYGARYWTSIVDLLQVLTLLAMERPISFSAEDIRDEKVREYYEYPLTVLPFFVNVLLISCFRYGSYEEFHQSSPKTSSLASISNRSMGPNPHTRKTTRFPQTLAVQLSVPSLLISATSGGTEFLGFWKQGKVGHEHPSILWCAGLTIDTQPLTNRKLKFAFSSRTLRLVFSRTFPEMNSSSEYNPTNLYI